MHVRQVLQVVNVRQAGRQTNTFRLKSMHLHVRSHSVTLSRPQVASVVATTASSDTCEQHVCVCVFVICHVCILGLAYMHISF